MYGAHQRKTFLGLFALFLLSVSYLPGCGREPDARKLRAAREQGFRDGYEAGKAAAREESAQQGTRLSLGWGFALGVIVGLCLVALLSAGRIEDALRRRAKARSAKRLLGPLPPKLDKNVEELAGILVDRYSELQSRIEGERGASFEQLLKSISSDVDTLVGRSARLLAVLQELQNSVTKAAAGRPPQAAPVEGAGDKVYADSLSRAEANIAKCQEKLWATINLIDSLLLRLSSLKAASLDDRAISQMALEIDQEIEHTVRAYEELTSEGPAKEG